MVIIIYEPYNRGWETNVSKIVSFCSKCESVMYHYSRTREIYLKAYCISLTVRIPKIVIDSELRIERRRSKHK